MKKILLVLMLFPILGIAQEAMFIKVIGQAIHIDKEPTFKGSVVLSAAFSSYPSEAISLAQMKLKYEEALKNKGISIDDLVERADLYTLMGYEKEGTLYTYATEDLKQFQQFLSATCFGLQRLSYDTAITIDAKERTKLIAEAIENARLTATMTAKEMGKSLGPVMRIEDNNRVNTEIRKGLYYDQNIGEHIYELTVEFGLQN